MDMHAAAGLLGERLGHEAGHQALLLRHRLDRALEVDRIVAGEQGVVAVLEVDLELAGRVLGHRGIRRDALGAACRGDRIGEAAIVVQVFHVVDLRAGVALSGRRVDRRARAAGIVHPLVEQVELQFHRHHRLQSARGVTLQHPLEHLARVGFEHAALCILHAQQQLRGRPWRPRHRPQRARYGAADAVLVADVVAQSRFLHGIAGDVGGDQRHRQAHAVAVDLVQRVAGDALAAQQPVHVGQQQVDLLAVGDGCQGGGIIGRQVGGGVVIGAHAGVPGGCGAA